MFFGGENFMDENKFDKGDLKKELKRSGFDDCIADDIADRVNDKKTDEWNADKGREQALSEIKMLIDNNNKAYDNFRQNAGYMNETMRNETMRSSSTY